MEKFKFPMPTMNITQGYNEGTHKGAFALDLAGEDAGIDWVEAPFTGVVKKVLSASFGNWYWVESLEPVLCANGEVDYMTVMFGHDNKMRHKEGDIIKQGEHLCAEGTSGNATGNHCHMEVGKGKYAGTWYPNQYGIYMLYNAVKPNEVMCVPDNYTILNDYGYAWKKESEVFEAQPVPTYKFNVGDKVVINGPLYTGSNTTDPVGTVNGKVTTITRRADGSAHPYNTEGDLGWMDEASIRPYVAPQPQKHYLTLPRTARSWNVYPLDKAPILRNKKGALAPARHGGLTYEIKGWAQPDVAIIDTNTFGRVQIYVAQGTGAIIK